MSHASQQAQSRSQQYNRRVRHMSIAFKEHAHGNECCEHTSDASYASAWSTTYKPQRICLDNWLESQHHAAQGNLFAKIPSIYETVLLTAARTLQNL